MPSWSHWGYLVSRLSGKLGGQARRNESKVGQMSRGENLGKASGRTPYRVPLHLTSYISIDIFLVSSLTTLTVVGWPGVFSAA
jgi:hypothetical protein